MWWIYGKMALDGLDTNRRSRYNLHSHEQHNTKETNMTRKHFRLMADVISQVKDVEDRTRQAVAMAAMCAASNPRFDSYKWYAACGVQR